MEVHDARVFPGFLTPVPIQLSFQSHRLLFSHASAEVRGENMLKRKFALTWSQTHNHQVMSLTLSTLSHPDGAGLFCNRFKHVLLYKGSLSYYYQSMKSQLFIFSSTLSQTTKVPSKRKEFTDDNFKFN